MKTFNEVPAISIRGGGSSGGESVTMATGVERRALARWTTTCGKDRDVLLGRTATRRQKIDRGPTSYAGSRAQQERSYANHDTIRRGVGRGLDGHRGGSRERDHPGRLRSDRPWLGPHWGCALEEGDVRLSEFNGLLVSPLSLATVGHPAWRNDPSYLKIEPNETVRVTNGGGRGHTFTEVAAFGGGRVPPLNVGLTPAPECAAPPTLSRGDSMNVSGLGVGITASSAAFIPGCGRSSR